MSYALVWKVNCHLAVGHGGMGPQPATERGRKPALPTPEVRQRAGDSGPDPRDVRDGLPHPDRPSVGRRS